MTYECDDVEARAVISEDSCDIQVRRSGGVRPGLWLKPSRIDGDGEFHLTVEHIGPMLKILGFRLRDTFPEST